MGHKWKYEKDPDGHHVAICVNCPAYLYSDDLHMPTRQKLVDHNDWTIVAADTCEDVNAEVWVMDNAPWLNGT